MAWRRFIENVLNMACCRPDRQAYPVLRRPAEMPLMVAANA
jgi:hypothetical protein